MSQLVPDVVQQVVFPSISSIAVYLTAPGVADQEMLAVPLSQPTDFSTFSGAQGAGIEETQENEPYLHFKNLTGSPSQ